MRSWYLRMRTVNHQWANRNPTMAVNKPNRNKRSQGMEDDLEREHQPSIPSPEEGTPDSAVKGRSTDVKKGIRSGYRNTDIKCFSKFHSRTGIRSHRYGRHFHPRGCWQPRPNDRKRNPCSFVTLHRDNGNIISLTVPNTGSKTNFCTRYIHHEWTFFVVCLGRTQTVYETRGGKTKMSVGRYLARMGQTFAHNRSHQDDQTELVCGLARSSRISSVRCMEPRASIRSSSPCEKTRESSSRSARNVSGSSAHEPVRAPSAPAVSVRSRGTKQSTRCIVLLQKKGSKIQGETSGGFARHVFYRIDAHRPTARDIQKTDGIFVLGSQFSIVRSTARPVGSGSSVSDPSTFTRTTRRVRARRNPICGVPRQTSPIAQFEHQTRRTPTTDPSFHACGKEELRHQVYASQRFSIRTRSPRLQSSIATHPSVSPRGRYGTDGGFGDGHVPSVFEGTIHDGDRVRTRKQTYL